MTRRKYVLGLLVLLGATACSDAAGPSPILHPAHLVVGGRHACRIMQETTTCWGEGAEGQLGIGVTPVDTTPVTLAATPVFLSLAAGATHTCGLDGSGVAWCWGSNLRGELGSGVPDQQCGVASCQIAPVKVAGGRRFRGLIAGLSFTCGLADNGQVYCWGLNDTGQLGTRNDGTSCGGLRCSPLPVLAADGMKVRAITAGLSHVCALTETGATRCWGYDGLPEGGKHTNAMFLPDVRRVAGAPSFIRISAGGYHTCAITGRGEAWCWGIDALGAGPTLLESDHPVRVAGGLHFTDIVSARFTACGLDGEGVAYCWGPNLNGEVGTVPVGSTRRFDQPTAVSGGFRFASLSAGWSTNCGVTLGGETACWGRGTYGELGAGHADTSTPVLVPDGS